MVEVIVAEEENVLVETEEEVVNVNNESNIIKGDAGPSAYEVAVANGFEGTEKEWLESLKAVADLPLKIGQGGTGATTAKEAQYNLLKDMNDLTSDTINDNTNVVFAYNGGSASGGMVYFRKITALWSYIQNKISSVLGLTAEKYNGTSAKATKLETARNIGKASFDGSSNIALDSIMGRATVTTSGSSNIGKYTKFARIDVSAGAYTHCNGLFNVLGTEDLQFGQLFFYVRTGASTSITNIYLFWKTLSTPYMADSVVAVKVSDGIYDLYYKPHQSWITPNFTLTDVSNPSAITLYSLESYVDSVTAVAVSKMGGFSNCATKDGNGNVIADFYAPKSHTHATTLFDGSVDVDAIGMVSNIVCSGKFTSADYKYIIVTCSLPYSDYQYGADFSFVLDWEYLFTNETDTGNTACGSLTYYEMNNTSIVTTNVYLYAGNVIDNVANNLNVYAETIAQFGDYNENVMFSDSVVQIKKIVAYK